MQSPGPIRAVCEFRGLPKDSFPFSSSLHDCVFSLSLRSARAYLGGDYGGLLFVTRGVSLLLGVRYLIQMWYLGRRILFGLLSSVPWALLSSVFCDALTFGPPPSFWLARLQHTFVERAPCAKWEMLFWVKSRRTGDR